MIGKATGSIPRPIEVRSLLQAYPDFADKLPPLATMLMDPEPGISYTQWEAYLAVYHKREIFIYRPCDFEGSTPDCPRDSGFVADPSQAKLQLAHYQRICALGRDRGQFLNAERLSSAVLRDLVEILPRLEPRVDVPPTKLRHTAERLIGRDVELTVLDEAWNNRAINVVVVRGKGGEGKTSLVASWMAELAAKNWRGAESVFDWSFYSQGTRDQSNASADVFIQAALRHFADPDPVLGGPDERGARLAGLVAERRSLLVLDGLEPLQYPPGPMHGQLKDPGMAALLRGLAGRNAGLCIVTTRETVDELKHFHGKTVVDHPLEFLSPLAGAALLHFSGATRAGHAKIQPDDKELQQASREVNGHALTLFLIGLFLRLTENGDIRRRDRMKLSEADREYKNDPERSYGHAFKAIEAYETWFAAGDADAKRQLAILRLLGLFDRPAPEDCLAALRAEPIAGLNDAVLSSAASDKQWRSALQRLSEINLVTVNDAGAVDCHPLIREYFAEKLKERQLEAFRAAHSRLFDHLCKTTHHRPDDLDGLAPLYQAIVHGCLAGRHQQACDEVYFDRILRGAGPNGFYSSKKLGAIGADLAAMAAFFDEPWRGVSPRLAQQDRGWLLNSAASRLRALGRLNDALEPVQASLEVMISQQAWKQAGIAASNLSEIELTLGRLADAVLNARASVGYADQSSDWFQQMTKRTRVADVLHHAGRTKEAGDLFAEAEQMQQSEHPAFNYLFSLQGFLYCDWLLAPAERNAWQAVTSPALTRFSVIAGTTSFTGLNDVQRRATAALKWAMEGDHPLLDPALDRLTLARVGVYRAALSRRPWQAIELPHVALAVNGLRSAAQMDYLLRGLLTAALYHFVRGDATAASSSLDEAQQIAERGPMPLHLADVHLHRARLFRDKAGLAKAAKLIRELGYGRRYDELADAEAAMGAG